MTAQVYVKFDKTREFEYHVERSLATDEARRWLDDQFVALGAEPLRLSGKILIADKILAVAAAAGASRFDAEKDWAHQFAVAASCALARDVLKVDVESSTIGY